MVSAAHAHLTSKDGGNAEDCLEQSLPAPAALVHLTSKDGGNAEGLLGTIPAMHVSFADSI